MPRNSSLYTWPLLAVSTVIGCSDEPASERSGARDVELTTGSTPSTSAASRTPATVSIHEKMGEIEFDYSWPDAATKIPALNTWLRSNAARLLDQTMKVGRADEAAAKEAGYPFRGHTYEEHWEVVADAPALLIMKSKGYVFTGGAHGMPIVTTLIWDKLREQRLSLDAVIDMPMLKRQVNDRFCTALDVERAKRRGEPVDASDPNELSEFVACVDLAKQTILPVSISGRSLDTIRVVIMPYEAGPYAEGIYQLDLPVDRSVIGAIKPAYRAAFAEQ